MGGWWLLLQCVGEALLLAEDVALLPLCCEMLWRDLEVEGEWEKDRVSE